jgi:hypothetical protein
LPRGYNFAQQYNAIYLISQSLPKGSFLYVREHLGTFKGLCTWKERNREFYQQISLLPKVRILSLERPSFEIIKICGTIATISGTVAIEGLVRQKNVIVFSPIGPYMMIQHNNLHRFESIKKLKSFLNKHQTSNLNFTNMFFNLKSCSMSGFEADEGSKNDLNRNSILWRDLARKKWVDFFIKQFDF